MAASYEGFRKGIRNFADVPRPDKNWVTANFIKNTASFREVRALDHFIASITAARNSIRSCASIFLSHSSCDKRFVRSLGAYLENHGLHIWLDEADLFAGEPLTKRLKAAVSSSTLVLAVLSQKAVKSKWVKKELLLALKQEINGRRVKVVCIEKEKCKIPKYLADKILLDFTRPFSRKKNRPVLLDTLMRHASESSRIHSPQKC